MENVLISKYFLDNLSLLQDDGYKHHKNCIHKKLVSVIYNEKGDKSIKMYDCGIIRDPIIQKIIYVGRKLRYIQSDDKKNDKFKIKGKLPQYMQENICICSNLHCNEKFDILNIFEDTDVSSNIIFHTNFLNLYKNIIMSPGDDIKERIDQLYNMTM